MKSQASEALNPESLQSQNRLRQKFESPIKPLGVLHGRLINNSGELTPAGAAVLESKLPRRQKFGVAWKKLPALVKDFNRDY